LNTFLLIFLAAISRPILYGLIIQVTNNAYYLIMLVSPFFLVMALLSVTGVVRGEAKTD